MFKFTILTIFPEMFPGCLAHSLAGKALESGLWSYETINIRDFGVTRHKNVDAAAYGGGHGLVMRPDVLGQAIDAALENNPDAQIYYLSPRGVPFCQDLAKFMAREEPKNIIIICGRFEGVDERIFDRYNVRQISIGDFILSGGEPAALTVMDVVIRLLPGVLNNQETLSDESFEHEHDGVKLIEYPLYTKPQMWHDLAVPDVLTSGNHGEIKRWQRKKSLELTREREENIQRNKALFEDK